MGIDQRSNIHAYWAMDLFNYTPWYHKQFRRDRFEILDSTMVHINSVEKEESTKDKIEPFLLLNKFQNAFYPERDIAIDEIVVKWKGHSKYKTYNPAKPEKYHIKKFGLCDSLTGYIYNILICFGKDTSYNDDTERGQSEKIFKYLLTSHGSGHHIFADRYYTTHTLLMYLTSNRMYYAGTLMANRNNFLPEIKKQN